MSEWGRGQGQWGRFSWLYLEYYNHLLLLGDIAGLQQCLFVAVGTVHLVRALS
jgi:hypothetical protein